jgi:hypothetical protein
MPFREHSHQEVRRRKLSMWAVLCWQIMGLATMALMGCRGLRSTTHGTKDSGGDLRAVCVRGSSNDERDGLIWQVRCINEGSVVDLSEIAIWTGFRNASKHASYWVPAELSVGQHVILDVQAALGVPPSYRREGDDAERRYALLLPGDSIGRWVFFGRHSSPKPRSGERLTVGATFQVANSPPAPQGALPAPPIATAAPVTITVLR